MKKLLFVGLVALMLGAVVSVFADDDDRIVIVDNGHRFFDDDHRFFDRDHRFFDRDQRFFDQREFDRDRFFRFIVVDDDDND